MPRQAAAAHAAASAPAAPQRKFWEVVGGEDTGGVVVRDDADLKSAAKDERLAFGALVLEEQLLGKRLCFRKISGAGPEEGWVSIELRDKPLLTRSEQDSPLVSQSSSFNPEPRTAAATEEGSVAAAAAPSSLPDEPKVPSEPLEDRVRISCHPCVLTRFDNGSTTWECDDPCESCSRVAEGPAVRWSCRLCDYDMCRECVRSHQTALKRPEEHEVAGEVALPAQAAEEQLTSETPKPFPVLAHVRRREKKAKLRTLGEKLRLAKVLQDTACTLLRDGVAEEEDAAGCLNRCALAAATASRARSVPRERARGSLGITARRGTVLVEATCPSVLLGNLATQLQDVAFALLRVETKVRSKARPEEAFKDAASAGKREAEAEYATRKADLEQADPRAVDETELSERLAEDPREAAEQEQRGAAPDGQQEQLQEAPVESESGEEEAPPEAATAAARLKMKCASPCCNYRVHSNPSFGSYCCIGCFETFGFDHGKQCERAAVVEEGKDEGEAKDGTEATQGAAQEEAAKDGEATDAAATEAKSEADAKQEADTQSKEKADAKPPKPDVSKEQKEAKELIEETQQLAKKMQDTASALLKDETEKCKADQCMTADKLTLAKLLQDTASSLLKEGVVEKAGKLAKKLQDLAFSLLKENMKAEQEGSLKKDEKEKETSDPTHSNSKLKEETSKSVKEWKSEVTKERSKGDPQAVAQKLQDAAKALLKDGEISESQKLAKEAEQKYRELGSRWRLGVALDTLAKTHLKMATNLPTNDEAGSSPSKSSGPKREEHIREALAAADEAVTLLRKIGHPKEEADLASARTTLAEVRDLMGTAEALKAQKGLKKDAQKNEIRKDDAKAWREAVAVQRHYYQMAPQGRGDHWTYANTLQSAASVLLKEGFVEEAWQYAVEAADLYRRLQAARQLGIALDTVARAHLRTLLEVQDAAGPGSSKVLKERQHLLNAKTSATEAVALLSKGNTSDWAPPLAAARTTLLRVRSLELSDNGGQAAMGRFNVKRGRVDLERTFGYAAGLDRPGFSRFDIRDDICLRAGGFTHGTVVRDEDRNKYVAVGVKLSDEDDKLQQLWFQPKSLSKPASCCFTGIGASDLRSLLTEVGREALKEVRSEDLDADEDSDGEPVTLCHECLLPLGATKYTSQDGEGFVHGECLAQNLLDRSQREDKIRERESNMKKARDRLEYNIGWRPDRMIPRNEDFIRERRVPRPPGSNENSMYCLALDSSDPPKVRLTQTRDPEAALNLSYLVLALRVRINNNMAPYFSLDTPRTDEQWQVKTFGPPWLRGTSVGEVLFQADYHLKELSMGDSLFEQPVIGMKNVWDFAWKEEAWRGREWFVVKDAKVTLGENNILVPQVRMGVEAREQIANERRQLMDAAVTSKGHPLVKYADIFTRFFDLVAERKSVVYQLREVSRAAIVAKFLVDNKVTLDDIWLRAQEEKGLCKMDLPFNKKERYSYEILVTDGKVKEQHGGVIQSMTGLYGGVDLNIDAFDLSMPKLRTKHIEPPNYAAIYADPEVMGSSTDLSKLSQRELRKLLTEAGGKPPHGPAEKAELIDMIVSLRPSRQEAVEGGAAEDARLPYEGEYEDDLRKLGLSEEQVRTAIEKLRERTKSGGKAKADITAEQKDFWARLEDDSEQSKTYKGVFQSKFADRRQEGRLFVPPVATQAYVNKLQTLVEEEREMQEERLKHFLSKDFNPSAPGPLWPSAWRVQFKMHCGRGASIATGADKRSDQLKASPIEAGQIANMAKPIFDRMTEDGLRLRVYRRRTLEVRTTQETGGTEKVGAVFEIGSGAGPAEQLAIVKATLFVKSRSADCGSVIRIAGEAEEENEEVQEEQDSQRQEVKDGQPKEGGRKGRGRGLYRFFVVYETDLADALFTERLADGTMSWEENPGDMEERYSLARVFRASDCTGTGITVRDVRAQYKKNRANSKKLSSKKYAEAMFEHAGGSAIVQTGPGGLLQLPGITPSASRAGGPQGPPPAGPHRLGQPPPEPDPAGYERPAPRPGGPRWNPWQQQSAPLRPHPAVTKPARIPVHR